MSSCPGWVVVEWNRSTDRNAFVAVEPKTTIPGFCLVGQSPGEAGLIVFQVVTDGPIRGAKAKEGVKRVNVSGVGNDRRYGQDDRAASPQDRESYAVLAARVVGGDVTVLEDDWSVRRLAAAARRMQSLPAPLEVPRKNYPNSTYRIVFAENPKSFAAEW